MGKVLSFEADGGPWAAQLGTQQGSDAAHPTQPISQDATQHAESTDWANVASDCVLP
jgi:hypothetical protein